MIIKYFSRANTSSGCVNLTSFNVNTDKIYIAKGSSKALKTRLMKAVAAYFDLKGLKVECMLSPFGNDYIDAVAIREKNFSIADFDCFSGKGEIYDTDSAIDFSRLDKDAVSALKLKSESALDALYSEYGEAKKIHDEWEKIYIKNMDFKSLDRFTKETLDCLVRTPDKEGRGIKYERFFGASTPGGSVNYIENLTQGLDKRYFIKGRPGTGKSTFLKKLAEKAVSYGYDTEVYYCSFDKNSLDMVKIPRLSFAVFDSTAPHELFPSEERDSILDFYKEARLSGIDERYEDALTPIKERFSLKSAEGRAALALSESYDAELEYLYAKAADSAAVLWLSEKIINEISR